MVRKVKNRSCSIKWAAKKENFQPRERLFSLTATFIELIRHLQASGVPGAVDSALELFQRSFGETALSSFPSACGTPTTA
jgi:hypothetical protein